MDRHARDGRSEYTFTVFTSTYNHRVYESLAAALWPVGSGVSRWDGVAGRAA